MSYTIKVSNIAPSTTEQQLHDFFTFCGTIKNIDLTDTEQKSAVINFEKPSAAHTALMLNGGTLDGSQLVVTSDIVHPPHDPETPHVHGEGPFSQSDKPRAGIAAEYLARGYVLSDQILQRAIEIDNKHGISNRFLNYIQGLDKTLGEKAIGPNETISARVQTHLRSASDQARAFDEQKGITKTANDYYTRAVSSPWGQKVFNFYTNTQKQIFDIHEEATRIATTQKQREHHEPTPEHAEPAPVVESVNPAAAPVVTSV